MKKLVLLMTILSAFSVNCFAQSTGESNESVDCAAIVDGQGKTPDVITTPSGETKGKETTEQ